MTCVPTVTGIEQSYNVTIEQSYNRGNHRAIVQPRLCDCSMVTQITLPAPRLWVDCGLNLTLKQREWLSVSDVHCVLSRRRLLTSRSCSRCFCMARNAGLSIVNAENIHGASSALPQEVHSDHVQGHSPSHSEASHLDRGTGGEKCCTRIQVESCVSEP